MKTNSRGFHIVEMILIVAILGILGFVGWRVYEAQTVKQPTNAVVNQSQSSEAPQINKTSDLDSASQTIDSLDTTDSSEDLDSLENELNSL